MEIDGAAIPALRGRDAITAFYAARPPQERLRAETIIVTGEGTTQVDFAWDSGAHGRLTAQWDRHEVRHVRLSPLVSPDENPDADGDAEHTQHQG